MHIIRQQAQHIHDAATRRFANLPLWVQATLVALPIVGVLLWIVIAYLVHWQQQATLFSAA